MQKVAPPIRLTVMMKAPLRPRRSPMRPNTSAPTGRKAKPTAKDPRAKRKAAESVSPAENCLAMMVANGTKTKKSYHSNAVPAAEAAMTRASDGEARLAPCAPIVPTAIPPAPLFEELARPRPPHTVGGVQSPRRRTEPTALEMQPARTTDR